MEASHGRVTCLLLLLSIIQGITSYTIGQHQHHGAGPLSARGQTGHETDWKAMAQKELKEAVEKRLPKTGKAKNLVFFLGDGMGITSITAGRWHTGQREGKKAFETTLSWDAFPSVGLAKTYNTDRVTPDSAGTATAYLCGEKAREGVIGVNQDVIYGDCTTVTNDRKLESMLRTAQKAGLWTGLITTTRITHATPAASYAHSAHRYWESDSSIPKDQKEKCPTNEDIALQLVTSETAQHLRVIMGGGRTNFLPNTTSDPEYPDESGRREDGRNLTEEWENEKADLGVKYKYVQRQSEFDDIDVNNVDYVLGLFNPDHMNYEADRENDTWGEPSLAEMVEKSIRMLQRGPDGFVLFVEGGRIDHAHHDTNAYRANHDVYALHKAVEEAKSLTNEEDTLIVVTADHSHAFSIAGYPHINKDLYGLVYDSETSGPYIADDGKPYTTLVYANGPGWYTNRNYTVRVNISELPEDEQPSKDNIDYLQDAGVPFYSETHGGEDVAVYASGPMSYLLTGTYEQSYIPHAMMYAACIGSNTDNCADTSSGIKQQLSVSLVIAAFVFTLLMERTIRV